MLSSTLSLVNETSAVTGKKSELSITPSLVKFDSIEPGTVFVTKLTIQNSGKKAQRIKITKPSTKEFSIVHNANTKCLAPGLEMSLEINFVSDSEGEFFDKIIVMTETERTEVLLHACSPIPEISFDSFVNMGIVVAKTKATKNISFKNSGSIDSTFSINMEEVGGDMASLLEIKPLKGTITANGECNICVIFDGSQTGTFRSLIPVSIEGSRQKMMLDVSAKVTEQRLSLSDPENGEEVSQVDFGTLLLGQSSVKKYSLINSGPQGISFAMQLSNDFGDEDGKDDSIKCTPTSGFLDGYSETPITIEFSSPKLNIGKGFKQTEKDLMKDHRLSHTAIIECPETKQKIDINIVGKAVPPSLKISEESLVFGECMTGERRDIALTLKNESEVLPLRVQVQKTAHFAIKPDKALLRPNQSLTVIASFTPAQLGSFNKTALVNVSGVYNIPVLLSGKCIGVGSSTKRPMTKSAMGTTQMSLTQTKASTTNPTYHFVEPNEMRYAQRTKAKFNRQPAWVKHANTMKETSSNPEYTFTIDDLEERAAHDTQYTRYLRKQRLEREKKNVSRLAQSGIITSKVSQSLLIKKRDGSVDEGVDLGMITKGGLKSPRLQVPIDLDDLLPKKSLTDTEKGKTLVLYDENRLVTKKFKPRPTTSAETNDCKSPLSATDMLQVTLGPKSIDFGDVTIGSVNSKNFSVINKLTNFIHAVVNFGQRPEMARSTPRSQVVPAGATAGFDIIFSSSQLGSFFDSISCTINDGSILKIPVTANIIPVEVDTGNVNKMLFNFAQGTSDISVNKPLVLFNRGNAEASYSIRLSPKCAFTVSESVGKIPPNGQKQVLLTYTPSPNSKNEENMNITIKNGNDVRIPCKGSCSQGLCQFEDQELKLGSVPVGILQQFTTNLIGKQDTVFWVDPDELPTGVNVSPTKRFISEGETVPLTIGFLSETEMSLSASSCAFISVNVRNGPVLRLPLVGEAILPDVELVHDASDVDPEHIRFSEVVIGAIARKKIVLKNTGIIPAKFELDLREMDGFSLKLCRHQEMTIDSTSALKSITNQSNAANLQSTSASNTLTNVGEMGITLNDFDDDLFANRSDPGPSHCHLLIPSNTSISFELCFAPSLEGSYSFKLPLKMIGLNEQKRDYTPLILAQAVTPKLVLDETNINFGCKVIARDRVRKVPSRREVTLTNTSGETVEFMIDADAVPEELNAVFSVEPSTGSLESNESCCVRVNFLPGFPQHFETILPLYIDGKTDSPYLELNLMGVGMYPCLAFDRDEVVLPSTPSGISSRQTFHIINNGFDSLELKHRLPSDGTRFPLKLSYPEGDSVSLSVNKLPVVVECVSRRPSSFCVNLEFLDDAGQSYVIPVVFSSGPSLLDLVPFVNANRNPKGHYDFFQYDPINTAIQFCEKSVSSQLKLKKRKDDRRKINLLAEEDASPSLKRDQPSVPNFFNFQEQSQNAESYVEPMMGEMSLPSEDRIRVLMACLRVAKASTIEPNMRNIKDFPECFLENGSSTLQTIIEKLSGTRVKLNNQHKNFDLNQEKREQVRILLAQFTSLLTHLKERGCSVHHILPEYLLTCDLFVGHKLRSDLEILRQGTDDDADTQQLLMRLSYLRDSLNSFFAEINDFEESPIEGSLEAQLVPLLTAPVSDGRSLYSSTSSLTYGTSKTKNKPMNIRNITIMYQLCQDRRVLCKLLKIFYEFTYKRVAVSNWFSLLTQIIRSFYLNRVTWRRLSSLPGFDQHVVFPGVGSGNSAIPPETAAEPETSRPPKAKREGKKGNSAPACLVGSNVYSLAELSVLKWVSFHTQRINPQLDRSTLELKDFDRSLRDGLALCSLLLAHCPSLGDSGRALSTFDRTSLEDETLELQRRRDNAKCFIDGLRELRLDFPITVDNIVDEKHNNSDCMLLLLVFLFFRLPSFVPKSTVVFEGSLSQAIHRTVHLHNPSSVPLDYEVTIDGCTDFKADKSTFTLEGGETYDLPIVFSAKFSESKEALLMLRSTSCSVSNTLVLRLESQITSKTPLSTTTVECQTYKSVTVDIKVPNLKNCDCQFKVTTEQTSPLGKSVYGSRKKNQLGVKTGGGRGKGLNIQTGRLSRISSKKSSVSTTGGVVSLPPGLDESYALAFHCIQQNLKLKAEQQGIVSLEFFPLYPGKYSCTVYLVDPKVGEFVYGVEATALLPEPLGTVNFRTDLSSSISRDLILPSRNHFLESAKGTLLERLNGAAKTKARDHLRLIESSLPSKLPFRVELNSPYFTAPSPSVMIDSSNPNPKGDRLQIVPSTAGAQSNVVSLSFHPKETGHYSSLLALRSPYEVRVFEVEADVTGTGSKTELQFTCPSGKVVTQKLPIVNVTDEAWNLNAELIPSNEESEGIFRGPSHLSIAPHSTDHYLLAYQPEWVGDTAASLTLTSQKGYNFKYSLKGTAEPPMASDTVTLHCKAREEVKHTFTVKNTSGAVKKYSVESDLPNLSGDSEIEVPPNGSTKYELTLNPQVGDTYDGTVTFREEDGQYQWFAVQLVAEAPNAEEALPMQTHVRKGISIEVTLENPTDEPADFNVAKKGHGLIGDSLFTIPPSSAASYEVLYYPLLPGSEEGSITFTNPILGEFWYKLSLTAHPSAPVTLPRMQCPLGSKVQQMILLENPCDHNITLVSSITNNRNYAIIPASVQLGPYSSREVVCQYTPSSLEEEESCAVTFSNKQAGEWNYSITGVGSRPSLMEVVSIVAPVHQQTSTSFSFRNPFSYPLTVSMVLIPDTPQDAEMFSLLLRRQRMTIGAFGNFQVPIAFSPQAMTDSHACVKLSSADNPDLVWSFPIHGVAEVPPTIDRFEIRCQARKQYRETLTIDLSANLGDIVNEQESFQHEVLFPEETRALASRSVSFIPIKTITQPGERPTVTLQVVFEPLRPFVSSAELILLKSSGGRWRYDMLLEAGEADVDDVIALEAKLHESSRVSFDISNQFNTEAPFKAFFGVGSPKEFAVSPSNGVLPPLGTQPQEFFVTFTPTEYGKTLIGKLIIETEDMRWTYEVQGKHPQYLPPQSRSKIDTQLKKTTVSQMKQSRSRMGNALRDNINRIRQFNMGRHSESVNGSVSEMRSHSSSMSNRI